MNENEHIEVVKTAEDSGDLAVAAVHLARSDDPAAHKFLGQVLQTPVFLARLDNEQDYAQPRKFLRVASVLDALEKNQAPSARALLIELMSSPVFIEAPSRAELLIEVSESIRPASPEVVVFWGKHTDPDDVYVNLLSHSLLENGSAPALELFESMLVDLRYPDKKRTWWIRKEISPHRNELLVLKHCLKMLEGGMPENLKVDLVEVLFAFQSDWFRPSTPVTAAPLSAFGPAERAQLRVVGEFALRNLSLQEPLKQAVHDILAGLQ